MLVDANIVIPALFGKGKTVARWQIGGRAFQFYAPGGMWWSKKGIIARKAPYTIDNPHPGQIETRIHFGEIARKYEGAKGFVEGLPVVAWHIKDEMSGYKAPSRMDPKDYPSKKFHTVHTLEQLKAMLAAKKKAVAARPAF